MNNKSAKEVMQEICFNALVEAVQSMKRNNIDNGLLREVKALHSNTTFADLPDYVKKSLRDNVDRAFIKLNSEGYVVTPKQ